MALKPKLGELCLLEDAPPQHTPTEVPVSIEEIDNSPPIDMDLPVKEPCPKCGQQMKVGDYVCWGYCYACTKSQPEEDDMDSPETTTQRELLPHELRVVAEKHDLDGRLQKLEAFIEGPTFEMLDAEEQERMSRQAHLMTQLSQVLGERIAAF